MRYNTPVKVNSKYEYQNPKQIRNSKGLNSKQMLYPEFFKF